MNAPRAELAGRTTEERAEFVRRLEREQFHERRAARDRKVAAAFLFVVLVLIGIASLVASGCAAPVTADEVSHLRSAIADERAAEAALPGHELDVATIHSRVDAKLVGATITAEAAAAIHQDLVTERADVTIRPGFEARVARVRGSIDTELVTIAGGDSQ